MAIVGTSQPLYTPLPSQQVLYLHQDHLGSTTALTNEQGNVVERMAYDAWGKRRFINGFPDASDTIVGLTTDRGYTEHEMLDELGIIHMNGRVYDPLIGRFMSADPFVQAPDELQSYNRYAYVMNNPLLYTDPSGYFSWRGLFNTIITIFAPAIAILPAPVASVVYSVASLACGPWAPACAGAAQAAISYYHGASWQDAVKSGVIAAGSAYLFQQAGTVNGVDGANTFARYAAHAGAGCISSVANGGQCGHGAASAVIGKGITNATSNWGVIGSGVAAITAGGISSVIGGGTFANGARTAAYGYLFNQVLTQAQADANARARNANVMQGNGCVAESANSCAGIPQTKGPASPETQEAVIKLTVSMTGAGLVVVGAIDVVIMGDQLLNNDLNGAAITASSIGIGEAAKEGVKNIFSKTTAGRIGAVAGAAWEYLVNLFK